MRWPGWLRERVRGLVLRAREDAEMDEELREHIERQTLENERLGMSAAEARRRALIDFGNVEAIREEVRDARGVAFIEQTIADVRYAGRALRRNPGFTAVALLTLALGIGANSAMFSVVNGVLLRPLPYPEAHELVLLHSSSPRTGELFGRVSLEDLEDWRSRTRTLESAAGFVASPTILTGLGEPTEVERTFVTEHFFEVLGVRAALGRALAPEDHRLRAASAVISHGMWVTRFGGSRDVIGRALHLRGEPFTVVGVMPASMHHPTPETDVWVPQSLVAPNMFSTGPPTREHRYLTAVGRMAAGAEVADVQRELNRFAAELAQTYPESNADWNAAAAVSLHESIVGDVDQALIIVLAVVGFILLIGCANLANLLLARGSARRREIAVRSALGAGRTRIVRQLLTESLVLALVGGALGLLVSHWGVQTIVGLSADTLPRVQDIRLDARVVSFAFVLALATGVLFGLMPALRVARSEPQHGLRAGRGSIGGEGNRLRGMLVIAEVALAVLLVVGAGLMARSFLVLRSVDPGFDPDRVLTVSLQLNLTGVPDDEMASFLVQRRELILERVRELAGVEAAGMINVFPLRQDGAFNLEYTRSDMPPETPGVLADTRYVDPGYLETMGIALLRGEQLPALLTPDAPVPVLVSESAAQRLWPGEDAVGRTIRVPWGESRVIGVVGEVRQIGLGEAPAPAVYFPQLIAPRLLATLVVRTAGDPLALAASVRDVIREIDPDQPIRSIMPLREVMAESIARDRFFTILFAVFGSLALILAAIGIYGVLAYVVRQRTQEIGVRMALGARTVDVLRMVAGGGMRLVGAGIILGTAAALALSRVLASQLYGIAPTDPLSFILAIGFLTLVAIIAIWVPARRAMRLPAMTALRPD